MQEVSEIVQSLSISLGVIIGGLWTLYLFRKQRVAETRLDITLEPKVIPLGESFLLVLDIGLHNQGTQDLRAKQKTYHNGEIEPIYEDEFETLRHSASLQLRRLQPELTSNTILSWYDKRHLVVPEGLAPEINLLDEWEDPDQTGRDEFILEPKDLFHLTAHLVLAPGHYVAKVTFFGRRPDVDWWARTTLLEVGTISAGVTP
jgi:hypothetical protein